MSQFEILREAVTMVFSSISGSDQIDNIARPVFSLFTETTFIGEIEPHAHNKAQFLYVISGVLTVEAVGGIWTIPPQCGLWIPGGVLHAGRISGHINIGNLYIDPTLTTQLPKNCGIIFVAPLLRELLLRFDRSSVFQMQDKAREARLLSVLLDELAAAPLEPIHLPMPTDRRLRRLTEAMINSPQLRFTVNEWGVRVGASSRTLSRLFKRETGLSFMRWRQQLHIGLALQRLATGASVTAIAGDLGYESTSAFIAMFRRLLGTTPARYFDTASIADDTGSSDLENRHIANSTQDATKSTVISLKKKRIF
ncbi:AraC family transcriptional regulator [Thalassospira sp.]|uniref:AraC family transcriptional regulator n=1 Tax=Thalassospira sp. TaxID=1912094 RepID=UPI003AA9692C